MLYIIMLDNKYISFIEEGKKVMQCKICKGAYVDVSEQTVAVTCGSCNAKLIEWPKMSTGYISTGRPRGWKVMKEFVDKFGNVFHKGVEQPDLKGTLHPTKISKLSKTKKRKSKKKEPYIDMNLVKEYKKKQKIKRQSK